MAPGQPPQAAVDACVLSGRTARHSAHHRKAITTSAPCVLLQQGQNCGVLQEAAASSEQRALHERGLRLAAAEADLDARAAEAEDLHARARQDRAEAAQLHSQRQVGCLQAPAGSWVVVPGRPPMILWTCCTIVDAVE